MFHLKFFFGWGGRELSDTGKRGYLDPEEFAVALYLMKAARSGVPVPTVLPANLVPPSKRVAAIPMFAAAAPVSWPSSSASPPPQAPSAFASADLEARRKEQNSKAEEELARRRQQIRDEEERIKKEADER